MLRFFDSLHSLEQFTSQLDSPLTPLKCQHCHHSQAWVSHGFVYRQRSCTVKEAVGKRLFCSDRYGRTGCGRTVQLYLHTEIPARHYTAAQVFIFISSLFAGLSVCAAYQRVAGSRAERQGWRWLTTLVENLSEFRRFLQVRHDNIQAFTAHSKRRRLILPTLQRLLISARKRSLISTCECACALFQLQQQKAFF